MLICDLPPALAGDAVALWHAAGLTRPWNDPHAAALGYEDGQVVVLGKSLPRPDEAC